MRVTGCWVLAAKYLLLVLCTIFSSITMLILCHPSMQMRQGILGRAPAPSWSLSQWKGFSHTDPWHKHMHIQKYSHCIRYMLQNCQTKMLTLKTSTNFICVTEKQLKISDGSSVSNKSWMEGRLAPMTFFLQLSSTIAVCFVWKWNRYWNKYFESWPHDRSGTKWFFLFICFFCSFVAWRYMAWSQ